MRRVRHIIASDASPLGRALLSVLGNECTEDCGEVSGWPTMEEWRTIARHARFLNMAWGDQLSPNAFDHANRKDR